MGKQLGFGRIEAIGRHASELFCATILFLASGTVLPSQTEAQTSKVVIATGWHPWYELKVDPENAENLIVCGSVWRAKANALEGFVYASSNGGKTWRKALSDRNSSWVSEQSCAFGPKHTAFFVSEASKIVDVEGRHHQGTTRIFSSVDAGQNWTEAAETAWADWSTSAVRRTTGELFTFYNDPSSLNEESAQGNTVGLLVFSPASNHISGPFRNSDMKSKNYKGVYPSNALCMKDGTILALYQGYRDTPAGRQVDLGLERIPSSGPPRPELALIATSNYERKCFGLDTYAMAYDVKRSRLFLVFRQATEAGCGASISSSEDGGHTWRKATAIVFANGQKLDASHPSVAVAEDGDVRLLWEENQEWLFTRVNDAGVASEPAVVHTTTQTNGVIADSLWSVFGRSDSETADQKADSTSVGFDVRTLPGRIWRSSGLEATQTGFESIMLGFASDEEQLYSVAIPGVPGRSMVSRSAEPSGTDVTRKVVLLYGRGQSFDNLTGTLSVEVRLGNRGSDPIETPICLKVVHVSSGAGPVAILNADNGEKGEGAVWGLSRIVAGDRLLPESTTYNTATLLFHIDVYQRGIVVSNNLLRLEARVIAGTGASLRPARVPEK